MAAANRLAKHRHLTDRQIDQTITNLCRCGTYERVRRAIHRAADATSQGNFIVSDYSLQQHAYLMQTSVPSGKKILLVVSNPTVSTTTGWPVGFWASELIHPWFAFTEAGYTPTISSPDGGKVELDSWSDPRDPSGYSAHDLISMGFINTPKLAALLNNTAKVSDQKMTDYDAIVVCGGQGPMFTYKAATDLHKLFLDFYLAGKPSAALCHGTCMLLYLKSEDGTPFIKGKTMTGFANSEEDYADQFVGQKIMPFRIEDEAKKLGANFLVIGKFLPFALRDGNLVTGQQQESARETARLVIEALGK